MNQYLFVLGQNQRLSTAEIQAVYPDATLTPKARFYLKVETDTDVLDLACRLGGTIKIAKFATKYSDDLLDKMAELIKQGGRKNFSISFLTQSVGESGQLEFKLKEKLQENGFSARFIEAPDTSLSPLILVKQHVTELLVDPIDKDIYVTVWSHDFKSWIERDRKKPFIDPHSGMLPPKLARIMVNLALGNRKGEGLTLLDPFCGTGTVLLEARLMGLDVIGSDLSAKAVEGTRRNLSWLPTANACSKTIGTSAVHVSDAAHLSDILKEKIHMVVTEPYLGPANFDDKRIPDIAKGLQKLYLGALKEWYRFLPKGTKIVMVFPQFQLRGRTISTSSFLDGRRDLGYNLLVKDLVFTRPNARIIRQIVILEKI